MLACESDSRLDFDLNQSSYVVVSSKIYLGKDSAIPNLEIGLIVIQFGSFICIAQTSFQVSNPNFQKQHLSQRSTST